MKGFTICFILIIMGAKELTAQNTSITWSALDMGFAAPASATVEVRSVAGQVITGTVEVGSTRIGSGFLAPLAFDTSGAGINTGYILYSRAGTPSGTIWMKSVDGTLDTQIISGAWPRLSHNGRYMLFHEGTAPNPANRDMHFYDFQTGGDTLLWSANGDFNVSYDWFDDDYHIVFDYSCAVRMINRDRTGSTILYSGDCYDDAPVARPGSWGIANHNSFRGIIVTDSLGINKHLVPGTGQASRWPAWSPDGEWISFGVVSPTSDSLYNYYKIRPDGTGLTALTSYLGSDNARFWAGGAWTRDGRYLLVPGTVNGVNDIYAIPTDGSGGIGRISITPGDPIDFVGSVTGNVNVTLTEVREQDQQLPTHVQLDQNYPNPFNPSTTVNYQLPSQSHVMLKVFDILGREVATLVNGVEDPGYKSIEWNASNYASGVYFYRLDAGSFTSVKKLLLLK